MNHKTRSAFANVVRVSGEVAKELVLKAHGEAQSGPRELRLAALGVEAIATIAPAILIAAIYLAEALECEDEDT